MSSLSIRASFEVAGRPAGSELADLAQAGGPGIFAIAIEPPLASAADAHVFASIREEQGNITRVDRRFSVGDGCAGDIDGDQDVDLSDLTGLLGTFGLCAGQPGFNASADFDASGCVDLADLTGLLSAFGRPCP